MKTLLITGANRGLGLEFCKQYAADGWRIFACCRNLENAPELQELAAAHPNLVSLHILDVEDAGGINELAQELADEPIDILLNNAGIYPDGGGMGFGYTERDAWIQAFLVNTMAPLKMAEAFISNLERGKFKTIATISSKMGSVDDNTSGGHYLYRSSKAAVNMVVKSMSIDLAPRGIIAVVLHPGWVLTDMGGPNALITPEQSISGMRKVIAKLTPADSGKFLGYDGWEVPW